MSPLRTLCIVLCLISLTRVIFPKESRMWLLIAMVLCSSVVLTVWYYWKPFFEGDRFFKQSDFTAWAIKGLGVPTLFWILINCGVMWTFGPFMPKVSMAKNAG